MDRLRNRLGKQAVPCMVTDRWLQFAEKAGGVFADGEYIELSVMTLDIHNSPKKLCDMVVTREDLLRAVNSVKNPD